MEGIHLQYSFGARGQHGADVENPLFDLLAALQEHGSIRHAADALGLSYRHVWGALRHWEEVLGSPLVVWMQGRRAQLTPFAQRLMWAERQARTRMTPHIEALRAELHHVLRQAHDPDLEVLEILASHDLGLPRLQTLAAPAQRLHLSLRFTGSEDALRSLRDGRCTVAGFHVPSLPQGSDIYAKAWRALLEPGRHKLIGSHRRCQGLMLRKGMPPLAGVADLATKGWRFVNRQPGSGTRMLMDHLLQAAGVVATRIDGYGSRIEHTHVAVAAAIAAGTADVGPGIEAAAHAFGLDFLPLVEEDYYLVCMKPALDSPAVRRLRAVLASAAWAEALAALPGYSVQRAGAVLSLTQALPWWRFRRSKARAAA